MTPAELLLRLAYLNGYLDGVRDDAPSVEDAEAERAEIDATLRALQAGD